jgi:hypothetical protein
MSAWLTWSLILEGSPWLFVVVPLFLFLAGGFWWDRMRVQERTEEADQLSARLGLPLETRAAVEKVDVGSPEVGLGYVQRIEGSYQGLRLTATDIHPERLTLCHARPLELGLYCQLGTTGWETAEIHERPALARRLAVDAPGSECFAVDRARAQAVLRHPEVSAALLRFTSRLNFSAGHRAIVDDAGITVTAAPGALDRDLLAVMHDVSVALAGRAATIRPAGGSPPARSQRLNRQTVLILLVGLLFLLTILSDMLVRAWVGLPLKALP